MKYTILALVLGFSAQAFAEVSCRAIKFGQPIMINADSKETLDAKDFSYDLSEIRHMSWSGMRGGYTETDLHRPYGLPRHKFTKDVRAIVMRDAFIDEDEGGGVHHVSCDVIVEVEGKIVLLRQQHYGWDVPALRAQAEKMAKVQTPQAPQAPKKPALVSDVIVPHDQTASASR